MSADDEARVARALDDDHVYGEPVAFALWRDGYAWEGFVVPFNRAANDARVK